MVCRAIRPLKPWIETKPDGLELFVGFCDHLTRCTPAPASFGDAGYVHPSLMAHIHQILQGRHGESGLLQPRQTDYIGSCFATVAFGSSDRLGPRVGAAETPTSPQTMRAKWYLS